MASKTIAQLKEDYKNLTQKDPDPSWKGKDIKKAIADYKKANEAPEPPGVDNPPTPTKEPTNLPVKQKAPDVKAQHIGRGDHVVFVNGKKRTLSRDAVIVLIQQGKDVEIPKNSNLTIGLDEISDNSNCRGCGR